MVKIVPDNYTFAKCVKLIKNRKELTDDYVEKLEEIVMDSAKAKAVIDASKMSMGMDISPVDLMNIEKFASRVIALAEYRKELAKYLTDKMGNVAPNLAALIGDTVGARLISHAGSLTNLAKYPASTVQILGKSQCGNYIFFLSLRFLREIKVCEGRVTKTAILAHLEAVKYGFYEFLQISEA